VALLGTGDGSTYQAGSVLWSYQVVGGISSKVTSIRSIPDVNNDGVDDCVATAEDYHTYCINGNGSGVADILWSYDNSTNPLRTGYVYQDFCLTSVPDIDGDSVDDVVIGTAGGSRSVIALSGKDGDWIWTYDSHEYGGGGWIYEVAPIQDIDGDGIGDVLACAGDDGSNTGPRRAYCLSGDTGAKIWDRLLGAAGFCVRAIDDLTGDGKDDVAVGTTDNMIHILNGATGVNLDIYDAGSTVWTVAAIEDISKDGKKDIVAGTQDGYVHLVRSDSASLEWPAAVYVGGIVTEVHIVEDQDADDLDDITVAGTMSNYRLLGGAAGANLWSKPSGQMAFATSPAPDLDGDGLEDVIGGSGYNANRVRVMSGTTGDSLWMRPTAGAVETVHYIESIDGDASPEVLVGTRSGEILCLAGGGGLAGVITEDDRVAGQGVRLWNHPNPTSATTLISYRLGQARAVNLAIFDVAGRHIATLVEGDVSAGLHAVTWDGCDTLGRPASTGLYFARLRAGDEIISRKIMLLR
jgi:hypothetical protein